MWRDEAADFRIPSVTVLDKSWTRLRSLVALDNMVRYYGLPELELLFRFETRNRCCCPKGARLHFVCFL